MTKRRTLLPILFSAILVAALPAQSGVSFAGGKKPGTIWTIAGGDEKGNRGKLATDEPIPATMAALGDPSHLVVANSGNIHIRDKAWDGKSIRVLTPADGLIETTIGAKPKVERDFLKRKGLLNLEEQELPVTDLDELSIGEFAVHDDGRTFITGHGKIYVVEKGMIKRFAGFSGTVISSADVDISYDRSGLAIGAASADSSKKSGGVLTGNLPERKFNFTANFSVVSHSLGDDGPAMNAYFKSLGEIALSRDGQRLYVVDRGDHRVRKIDLQTGIITTVAGNGKEGYSEDGTKAAGAPINSLGSISVTYTDPENGNDEILFVEDEYKDFVSNDLVRKIGTDGRITTVAGIPRKHPQVEGKGLALKTSLRGVYAVRALPTGGFLLVQGKIVYKVENGRISPVAGRNRKAGTSAQLKENVQATLTDIGSPADIAVLPPNKDGEYDGFLIADSDLGRVRQVKHYFGKARRSSNPE